MTVLELKFPAGRYDATPWDATLMKAFPEPGSGPFALGYGSHFGLGLFVPAAPASIKSMSDTRWHESPASLVSTTENRQSGLGSIPGSSFRGRRRKMRCPASSRERLIISDHFGAPPTATVNFKD